MACAICQKRKGKRACPAKGALICSQCCGREREVTIACPFECEYLLQSRDRDHADSDVPPPHPDVKLGRTFAERNTLVIEILATAIMDAAADNPAIVDRDVRDALDAAIRTQRTRASGIDYQTEPESAFARPIAASIQAALANLPRERQDELGMIRQQDFDILETLVFFARVACDRDNGRPKGRGFLHGFAMRFDKEREARAATGPSLIIPGR